VIRRRPTKQTFFPMPAPPVILTIAGSDNSCGAGAQADLQAITALGGYAQTAVTCVVAEVPGHVSAIQPVRASVVAGQIRLSFRAFPVAAIKTGMLYSTAIIRAVASALGERKERPPLVVDPVMVASSGHPLLQRPAIAAYESLLFPMATLVTPNLHELRMLSRMPCRNIREMKRAGAALVERHGCAFLLKGGHLESRRAVDILATAGGFVAFSAPFHRGLDVHGTGCVFSAAIATGLGRGLDLEQAVADGKKFLARAIKFRHRWEKVAALNHRPPGTR